MPTCLSPASDALLTLVVWIIRDILLASGAWDNDTLSLRFDRVAACSACCLLLAFLLKQGVLALSLTRALRSLFIREPDISLHIAGVGILPARPAGLGTTLLLHRLYMGGILIIAPLALLCSLPFEKIAEESVDEETSVGPVMMILKRLKYKKDDNFEVRHYPTLHTELVAVVLLPPAHHLDYEIRNQNFYGRLGIFAKLRQGLC